MADLGAIGKDLATREPHPVSRSSVARASQSGFAPVVDVVSALEFHLQTVATPVAGFNALRWHTPGDLVWEVPTDPGTLVVSVQLYTRTGYPANNRPTAILAIEGRRVTALMASTDNEWVLLQVSIVVTQKGVATFTLRRPDSIGGGYGNLFFTLPSTDHRKWNRGALFVSNLTVAVA
jgi:hypothetical protein